MARLMLALALPAVNGVPVAATLDDGQYLLQESSHAHLQQASLLGSSQLSGLVVDRLRLVAGASSQIPQPLAQAYCGTFPSLCKPPFNCQTYDLLEMAKIPLKGMAAEGKADLRLWCLMPLYAPYIEMCNVKKDLVTAAHIQHNLTKQAIPIALNYDASYCFIEGHCTNEEVTAKTTIKEAEKMCDRRFGHKAWTEFGHTGMLGWFTDIGLKYNLMFHHLGDGFVTKTGEADTPNTGMFLKAACAMGNFHCDVMYCKETYCKDPEYVKMFSHLQPKVPHKGHKPRKWPFKKH